MRLARVLAGALPVAGVLLALLPHPDSLRTGGSPLPVAIDPALRVPFSSIVLRMPEPRLAPGDRIVGIELPGEGGLRTPRGRATLLAAARQTDPGATVRLAVQGADRERRRIGVAVVEPGTSLRAQWLVPLAGLAFLLFALAAWAGGRHPVAVPLCAVSSCLGAWLLAALDPVLPGDAGLLGLAGARARIGMLAVSLLPAALLHLAVRFPVAAPRFRRPGLAALPYWIWAIPAATAQLRFGDPGVASAVERVALTAAFGAGALLVFTAAFPRRRLTPVERARARATTLGFAVAGAGPLAVFVRGAALAPDAASAVTAASLALPLCLGWCVVRYRLLDPPPWLRAALVSVCAALCTLLASLTAVAAASGSPRHAGTIDALPVVLLTGLLYPSVRAGLERVLRRGRGALARADELLSAATVQLAGASDPDLVLERLLCLIHERLGRPAQRVGCAADGRVTSLLAQRGLAIWETAGRPRSAGALWAERSEDPDAARPEAVLVIARRDEAPRLVVLSARDDGLPLAPEERPALEALARIASVALGDAETSSRLERTVRARTRSLRMQLADRAAVLSAARGIQAAIDSEAVVAAATEFLGARCEPGSLQRGAVANGHGVSASLSISPARCERLSAAVANASRARALQSHTDTVAALANLALERIHLLAELKREVARQARELAATRSGRQHLEFARRVAHELRRPSEEIVRLARRRADGAGAHERRALRRIEGVASELARRIESLVQGAAPARSGQRVDLVGLANEAVRRVALLRPRLRYETRHELPRLPLRADRAGIGAAVENLVDNAAKAARQRVTLRTTLLHRGARVDAQIEVEDDGAGIPDELGEQIFEAGVGRFRDGLGLGLALCREVVAAHGGDLEVESGSGRTVFRMRLPQLGSAGASA
ncbi:MAG: HAMP domain-containing sensor histidine kinase [Myxococcota bacterium]|nr:HAMP domain-containing sensor histidine kinase [Myxococcota bacterium]